MPNKISNIKDDNLFHKQLVNLENQMQELYKRLNEFYLEEKDIQSRQNNGQTNALKDSRDKIIDTQRKISAKAFEMSHLDRTWEREKYRRKHCPIPSAKCPISPLRPA